MKKLKLVEDEKNFLMSQKLKIPLKNFFHDREAASNLLEAFLRNGFEVNIYFNKRDNKFKAISFLSSVDKYCPSISGSTWEECVANCIYHRIKNGPYGDNFN